MLVVKEQRRRESWKLALDLKLMNPQWTLFLKKQLSKVDFPAFGEPTIAARKSFVAEAIALDAM